LHQEIATVLENIGVDKFVAIITDCGGNVNLARRLIYEDYNHILNIRCAAHAINLIASDLAESSIIKDFIPITNSVVTFFTKSHLVSIYFKDGLTQLKVKGSGLKTYVKTRWATLWDLTSSIVHSHTIFDWVCNFITIYINV
jgi:hypothetical protein